MTESFDRYFLIFKIQAYIKSSVNNESLLAWNKPYDNYFIYCGRGKQASVATIYVPTNVTAML